MNDKKLPPVMLTSPETLEDILIENENRQLMKNEPVLAVIEDDHEKHFQEHGKLIASIRDWETNPVVDNIKKHMHEHVIFMKQLNKKLN